MDASKLLRENISLKVIKYNQEGLLKYWNDVVINGESGVKFRMRMVLE